MRMRTVDQAAAWLREQDPETALTKTALRRLVVTGQLPSVRVGQKYLISLETLEDYLAGAVPLPIQAASNIRRIEL
ncbi:MAG: helix-turn-helix domain-containing protein [Oscillospiraceae bacterium]|nr:helix-turn-helix domain-containing protein [Oscillospiraceae bacterium]